tara:strand:+ start:415 stop:618 length:204 start_codon:yes stop_codon:yes gene_type:complete
MNWIYFDVNYNKPYYIHKFDDGNEKYNQYENVWYICGLWRGKVKLINIDKKTIIKSISKWKISSFSL